MSTRKPEANAAPKAVAGAAPQDDDEALADTPQIRALRMAVTVMGLILIVGFLTVIARVVYLASRPPAQAVAASGAPAVGSAVALKPEALLELPADASVKAVSLSGDRLAVQYVSPRGDGIAILDLASGRVVSRVKLAAEPR